MLVLQQRTFKKTDEAVLLKSSNHGDVLALKRISGDAPFARLIKPTFEGNPAQRKQFVLPAVDFTFGRASEGASPATIQKIGFGILGHIDSFEF